MALVYKIVNKINHKIYIGKTVGKLERRVGIHKYIVNRTSDERPLYQDIRKYGWDSFDVKVIEDNLSTEEARKREQFYIEHYNSISKGYNQIKGGGNPVDIDYEKIKELYLKYKQVSIVSKLTGVNDQTIRNILYNYKKISDQITDTKTNKAAYKKIVYMIDTATNKHIRKFDTYMNAARYIKKLGITPMKLENIADKISLVCRGKRKTAYGYRWELYKKDKMAITIAKIKSKKQVKMINLENGKILKIFDTLSAAAVYIQNSKKPSVKIKTIRRGINKSHESTDYLYAGYKWRIEYLDLTEEQIEQINYQQEYIKNNKIWVRKHKPIAHILMKNKNTGKVIKVFDTISEAVKHIKTIYPNSTKIANLIYRAAGGDRKTTYGYAWEIEYKET